MFQWLRQWRQETILKGSDVSDELFDRAFKKLPLIHRLTEQEHAKLKRLAILFMYYKSIDGVEGFTLTKEMKLEIALQACLPILNLGLDWYYGWVSVVVYPGSFSKENQFIDEYGIEHQEWAHLNGESWQRGPVIISWDEVLHDGEYDGRNVVIHEFAHKLDMLNGRANGFPPLHKEMSSVQWSQEFNKSYNDFLSRIQQQNPIPINQYAATSPAEFFAVFSEYFFENPLVIKHYYSAVYDLLVAFYRQNPLK